LDISFGQFGTNAIGSLLLDPSDATGNTIYAGTGEPNASVIQKAGVGIYKSTDGGSHWTFVPGSDIFFQRAIGQMASIKMATCSSRLRVPSVGGARYQRLRVEPSNRTSAYTSRTVPPDGNDVHPDFRVTGTDARLDNGEA